MRLSYRNHFARTLALAVALATSVPALSAPASTVDGAITGTVRTDSGAVAAGVEVRLAGTTRRTSTDAGGAFRFEALTPGEYVIEAESPPQHPTQPHITECSTVLDANATGGVLVHCDMANEWLAAIDASLRLSLGLARTPRAAETRSPSPVPPTCGRGT